MNRAFRGQTPTTRITCHAYGIRWYTASRSISLRATIFVLAMHPCLTIDEILTRIISHLAPLGSQVPSKRDVRRLTALALTCKTFHDPAMAASWASLVGLNRLMRAFPEGIVAFDVDDVSTNSSDPAIQALTHVWSAWVRPCVRRVAYAHYCFFTFY